jgi:uncharacterized protein (TIGR04552 family)
MRERTKTLEEFTLTDLEAVRLILRGDSVIDWHRLNFDNEAQVRDFLRVQELRPEDMQDRARMEQVKRDAIAYLRRHLEYPIPKPVEQLDVEHLLMLATGKGHRQTCACAILKVMHIIHHVEGRELLFTLPLSDAEVFQVVEEKVYRVIGSMLAGGLPIIEFVGGRKHKDSLYTKLLSKQDTIASQIYDKLRFRIVTRSYDDVFPVIQYLTQKLFPFNYAIPGQSINSMFHFRSYCEKNPHLAGMLPEMQGREDDKLTPTDNRFTAESYRVIHFVVDMPVRLPPRLVDRAPASAQNLGSVIFVVCEFQVVDRETEALNEQGDASHARYKERQRRAVMRRLQIGARQLEKEKESALEAARESAKQSAKEPAKERVRESSTPPRKRKPSVPDR